MNADFLSCLKSSEIHSRSTTCSPIQIVSGDSCGSLAARCGITASQFTSFNPQASLCSSLVPGNSVCCSAERLLSHPFSQAMAMSVTHTLSKLAITVIKLRQSMVLVSQSLRATIRRLGGGLGATHCSREGSYVLAQVSLPCQLPLQVPCVDLKCPEHCVLATGSISSPSIHAR